MVYTLLQVVCRRGFQAEISSGNIRQMLNQKAMIKRNFHWKNIAPTTQLAWMPFPRGKL